MPVFEQNKGQEVPSHDSSIVKRPTQTDGTTYGKDLTVGSKTGNQQPTPVNRPNSTKDQSPSKQDLDSIQSKNQDKFTSPIFREKLSQSFKKFDAIKALRASVVSEDKVNYFFKPEKSENTSNEKGQLAFSDEDTHLTAATDLPVEKIAEAAKAMVALAVKKGWNSIEVGGTRDFQEAVRVAAQEFGLEVTERDDSETQIETTQQKDELNDQSPSGNKNNFLKNITIDLNTSDSGAKLVLEADKKKTDTPKTDQQKLEEQSRQSIQNVTKPKKVEDSIDVDNEELKISTGERKSKVLTDDSNEPAKLDTELDELILLNNALYDQLNEN